MISRQRIRREMVRRAGYARSAEIQHTAMRAELFQKQIDFILDPSRRKTCDPGRRGGKTHSFCYYLASEATKGPDHHCLFLSLTKPHAVDLLWIKFTTYLRQHKIKFKPDNLRHVVTLENGSRVVFGGVSNKEEREKHRGFPWRLVICDETGSFGPYLDYLIDDILEATLLDYDGTLVLGGTPSPQCAGRYYQAVHDNSGVWTHHHWTVLDNPYIPQWRDIQHWRQIASDFLRQVQAKTPPAKFKREYLGQWVRDQDSLLYLLEQEKNVYDELPKEPMDFVIGADTGFNDASAIVVLGASRVTNRVYVVHEWARAGVLIDGLAQELATVARRYRNAPMVIDPANKQLVESMRQIYNLPLEPADKLGKRAHIDLLNSWLFAGKVKFPRRSSTYDQMSILEWNAKRTAESESFPADLADSMLYAFTRITNWNNQTEAPKPLSEADQAQEEERKMIEAAVARARGSSADPFSYNEPEWGDIG